MIVVERRRDWGIEEEYIYEAYRRLYSMSIGPSGRIESFDYFYLYSKFDSRGLIDVKFEDYFCPSYIQNRIVAELLNEEYVLRGCKTVRKLRKSEREKIKTQVSLGFSPIGNLGFFVDRHPHLADFMKKLFPNEKVD